MLPPASVTPVKAATSQQAVEQPVDVGEEKRRRENQDSSASRGAAPMAAMSLTLTASAL